MRVSSKISASSPGICGSGCRVTVTPPSGVGAQMRLIRAHSASVAGKSSRVCPPRLSCRSSAARAMHSLTISMFGRSSARCQPGLYCRCPSTDRLATRTLSASIRSSACSISAAVRMMPTRSCIVCCRSCCTVYGFSPPSRSNGESAARAASARSSSEAGDVPAPGGRVRGRGRAGPSSEHEQVGQRVAAQPVRPVHAAGDLARREQPGHPGGLGVGVDLHPAHHVVAGGPDLHRLGGDVDLGQLLELVVHRRQPLADVLRRPPRGDVEEDAAVRRPAAGLHLAVDRAGDLVTREQFGGRRLFFLSSYQRSASASVSAVSLRKKSGM